jgi:hypothetical protein
MPQFDEALAILEQAVPIEVNVAEHLLVAKQVTDENMSLEAILKTAALFGRQTSLGVQTIEGEKYLLDMKNTKLDWRNVRLRTSGLVRGNSTWRTEAASVNC